MDQHRFDTLTRSLCDFPSRRRLLRGLAGAGLGLGLGTARLAQDGAAKGKGRSRGKVKHEKKRRNGLCTKDGTKCRTPGNNCQKEFCLKTPFTIEASWTAEADHDTYLFVPPQDESTGPAPYIDFTCNPGTSRCEEAYPFACVDGDERESGDEVTTFHRLLPGTYEYWVDTRDPASAGAVTVVLKDSNGRIVREWSNPATTDSAAWHVFDVDGHYGQVTAIDRPFAGPMPDAAFESSISVCPSP